MSNLRTSISLIAHHIFRWYDINIMLNEHVAEIFSTLSRSSALQLEKATIRLQGCSKRTTLCVGMLLSEFPQLRQLTWFSDILPDPLVNIASRLTSITLSCPIPADDLVRYLSQCDLATHIHITSLDQSPLHNSQSTMVLPKLEQLTLSLGVESGPGPLLRCFRFPNLRYFESENLGCSPAHPDTRAFDDFV
ncbi:hypothetical protein BDQ12DRAFT_374817 [Crucibulum laeve]|uniref:F-box domain-containing protein n=1 Tax=Crucibulum laeve TaxID=68775 RepID=A0A5C3LPN8_9AGAR|nr:hypothetical protein BDQ12DRAFT_374817 [Crucibulum laeve]